jgi:hypothetical protein
MLAQEEYLRRSGMQAGAGRSRGAPVEEIEIPLKRKIQVTIFALVMSAASMYLVLHPQMYGFYSGARDDD